MATCARCGSELPQTARFCPTCGRPVEPEVGPAAPPPTPPIWPALRPPPWLTSDWALVGLGVVVLLGLLFGLSALVGMVASVAVFGSVDALPCGAGVGAHLAFAAFGARAEAACHSETGAALAVSFLPLFWALTGGLATEAALRFAWPRLVDDRRRRIAFVGKLAAATGVALGLIAGLISGGNIQGGSGFASRLNGGEAWFYAGPLVWFWGWLALRRRAVRIFEAPVAVSRFRPWRRLMGEGALAFGALATGLSVIGLAFSLAVADGNPARLGLIVGFPVVGFSLGAVLADGALGTALAGAGGHTSLFHFGLPARPGSGAAPAWLFAALLLAPAMVAAMVWRRLGRDRPADEQSALTTGAGVAAGFAAAAWGAAVVGRVSLYAGPTMQGGGFSLPLGPPLQLNTYRAVVEARPDPTTVLALSLLSALAGGLAAAFIWAGRHGARWHLPGGSTPTPAGPGPPPGSPPPSAAPPAAPPMAGPAAWLLPETSAGPAGAGGGEAGGQEEGGGEPPLEEPPPEAGKP